ncbi:hypothetical protein BY996DRAFT_8516743 [Phakopsora pachyrhizi]|nr:hypothetical protein BY996DRAFT_8516743 [Phakopsora pachyrhizi]
MPDTSGASSPEANQSTVQKILRGGGWSFGTLNRTKSNSTVTRAVNPQALFTPSEQVKQLPLFIQYALPIVSIASACFDWIYSGIEMVSIYLGFIYVKSSQNQNALSLFCKDILLRQFLPSCLVVKISSVTFIALFSVSIV